MRVCPPSIRAALRFAGLTSTYAKGFEVVASMSETEQRGWPPSFNAASPSQHMPEHVLQPNFWRGFPWIASGFLASPS
jgi:hypothetical protein